MFVKELEITLENGMKISGELDLPERQGQWKTIILFHGSGPSDRHATVESMGGIVSRNFDLLSEGFVKARYAVFRYDKRENYDIEIIIRDAREVTRFVSGLSEVEGILFYGWSEGVRVCTTLVSDFPNAQALILQSGIAEGWKSFAWTVDGSCRRGIENLSGICFGANCHRRIFFGRRLFRRYNINKRKICLSGRRKEQDLSHWR